MLCPEIYPVRELLEDMQPPELAISIVYIGACFIGGFDGFVNEFTDGSFTFWFREQGQDRLFFCSCSYLVMFKPTPSIFDSGECSTAPYERYGHTDSLIELYNISYLFTEVQRGLTLNSYVMVWEVDVDEGVADGVVDEWLESV